MPADNTWIREPGPRIEGTRDLDGMKVQAPGVVRIPSGGYRLFYTAVGPGKPFPDCQGYILSAISDDGITFRKESGIRVAPDPSLEHASLRVLAPTVTSCPDGRWRMYFEARGPADRPTVVCSAISPDMVSWEYEEGIRLQGFEGIGGPRYVALPDGRGRIYAFASEYDEGGLVGGSRISQNVISAVTADGLAFEPEPGYRLTRRPEHDALGITAADVIVPAGPDDSWHMLYSSWQDLPPGTAVPSHPSSDPDAVRSGSSADFAAASIAVDLAGYRSRIFTARSPDGLTWEHGECVIEGGGHDSEDIDGVHAEDMSVVALGDGRFRVYYAACNRHGNWRIASAVTT